MEKIITQNEEKVASSAAKGGAIGTIMAGVGAAANKVYLAPDIASALGFKLSGASTAFGGAGVGLGGTAVGLAGASATAFLAGSMIERNAETATGKALGKGMAVTGGVGTLAGTVGGVTAVFSLPTWAILLSTFGGAIALMLLYSILSGNKKEAEDIITDKLGEEKGKEIIKKLDKEINNSDNKKEINNSDNKKEIIKV